MRDQQSVKSCRYRWWNDDSEAMEEKMMIGAISRIRPVVRN
jgi:hypothetical protein